MTRYPFFLYNGNIPIKEVLRVTNRDIINRLKELGYRDVTEDSYWEYATYGKPLKQELQKDYLTFRKDFGEGRTLSFKIENDKWSFNGLSLDDRVISNGTLWIHPDCDNEDFYRTSRVLEIGEDEGVYIRVSFPLKDGYRDLTRTMGTMEVGLGFDSKD